MRISYVKMVYVAAGLVLACAVDGRAQVCGAGTKSTDIFQDGDTSWVQAYIQTSTNVASNCPYAARAEGYIDGGTSASDTVLRATANVFRNAGKSYGQNAQAFGHHFLIHEQTHQWSDLGDSEDSVTVMAPPTDTRYGCEFAGGTWQENFNACQFAGDPGPASPVVLDMAHNGIRLTSVQNGVLFDLDADGAPEQIAWTRLNSDDAWLAMDRNGNGKIDSGAELFGNFTPAYPTPDENERNPNAANGFEALRFLENPFDYGASRADERLDARDAAYARVLVWTDRNHNGISEPDELQSAAAAGLLSISLNYQESKREDRHGNQFRQKSRAWFAGGVTDSVWDVWLVGMLNDAEDDTATP
jgi:hypothetical protein